MENSRQEFLNEFLFENVCLSQREGKVRCGGGKTSLRFIFSCVTPLSQNQTGV